MTAAVAHPPRLSDDTLAIHWLRRAATNARRAARLLAWAADGASFPAPVLAACSERFPHLVYEQAIGLRRADAEPLFEQGKRVNLELAAPAFDGLLLEPGRPFSFWRTLGRATEERGFRPGMELRGGCIVPAIGGDLCLLSNALFEMAVRLGLPIVERHGHSLEAVPPAPGAAWGLDATVFWPHVDLRFVAAEPLRLEVAIAADALQLRVRATRPAAHAFELVTLEDRLERLPEGVFRRNRIGRRRAGSNDVLETVAVNRRRVLAPSERRRSCLTCNETGCHSRTVPGGVR